MARNMAPNSDTLSLRGLAHWYGMLDSLDHSGSVDCAYPAFKLLRIILDIGSTINIDSIPGNETERNDERIHELRQQVNEVNTLLHRPSSDTAAIVDGCREALEMLFYLLELVDLHLAIEAEILCLVVEDEACFSKMTTSCSNHWKESERKSNAISAA